MTQHELEALLVDQAARGAVTGTAAGSIASLPGARKTVSRLESDLGKRNSKYSGCMVRKGYKVSAP